MPSLEAFILTADQRSRGNTSSILLFGASNAGPVEILCDYRPYFFADARVTPEDLKGIQVELGGAESFRALSGRSVRKAVFKSVQDAERARLALQNAGIPHFESDVRPRERFLMDLRINGGVVIEGEPQARPGLLRFDNPKLTGAKVNVPLRLCSIDIETSITSGSVLSIAADLTGKGPEERRVFMIGGSEATSGSLTFVPDERALFAAFLSWFHAADPDILLGWNVIGFDLHVLQDRAAKLGVSFGLGREGRAFALSERTGRFSRAFVPGRVVLDGPQLLRSSFYSFESYSLEAVAQSVLGEGKLIGPSGGVQKAYEIERLFREDKQALADYNLKDTILVTRIFESLGLLELTRRRTELSGMLLDQVGMSTASLDHFYLPRLHDEGFVAPNVGEVGYLEAASGGYVMDPVAGIYDNIVGLDFQSLYPSIIRTFNIDPLSRACAGENPISTPTGIAFSRSRSILPAFIGELMKERQRAKKERNKALSQAVKILMNSFYGVMGSAGSRLYHPSLPDAITSTGQWLLIESRRYLEEKGHKVIYGDTDSLFVQLKDRTRSSSEYPALGEAVAKELTDYWRTRLKLEYQADSFLTLDFKRHYLKFLVPSARGGEGGAKKRYAGLVTEGGVESVEFVGLEVIRSDWTKLAQDFQQELYRKVFKEEPIEEWVRDFVARVKAGEFNDKLVYRKRLHKPLHEYGASPPPYVRAARMLPKPGREIKYVMTKNGPVPVELGPGEPDYAHYIEKQLKPVADSILEATGGSFQDLLSAQLKLF